MDSMALYEWFELFFNTINPNYCDDYETENLPNISDLLEICSDYFDKMNSNV